jgi:hypothetical protein
VQAISRRSLLRVATASGLVLAAGPTIWSQPAIAGTVGPEQLHLQFGQDAATEMTASWATAGSVSRPRLRLGTASEGFGRTIEAETLTYTDGLNSVETITHHARITGLRPDTSYVYEVTHDGATPVQGAFRTAPVGRSAFRFTSFGDLATGNPVWSKSSINGLTAIAQVEQFDPVVHLMNGDLSYANVNQTNQPGCWADFMNNSQDSAANRPWMPTLGNHEIEIGNGDLGYDSYNTRFQLPDNGTPWPNNWYKFQVGSVLFIALDNNEVVYQNDGAYDATTGQVIYNRGYSNGAQTAWLERTLAAARRDSSIDWIIPFMHQPAMSSSTSGSGGDLGIRQQFMDLFYEYGVDLVLAGHDHDYERTYAVHGTDSGTFLRPTVVSTDTDVIDTSKGLVQLVLGGGGTSSHDDVYGAPDPNANDVPIAQIYTEYEAYKVVANETEDATWSAVRDPDTTHPWGIAVFDVDPGAFPGDETSITMTYYHTPAANAANPFPAPVAYDSFKAVRRRCDGWFNSDLSSTSHQFLGAKS